MTAAQDLFWLAHYTFNTINPLVEEAKVFEPTVQLGVDVTFGHEAAVYTKTHSTKVEVHWDREGMLAQSMRLNTKSDVDKFAGILRTKVDKLKADTQQQEILTLLEPVSY